MTDQHKTEDIRSASWVKNAPEWLGEVIAQLTENRHANGLMLERLLNHEKALGDKAVILRDSQDALIKAVSDLKEFAHDLYGPQSAFAQLNTKIDGFVRQLAEDRKVSDGKFDELRLAQQETDDHMEELSRQMNSEFDVFRNRLKEIERRLGMGQ